MPDPVADVLTPDEPNPDAAPASPDAASISAPAGSVLHPLSDLPGLTSDQRARLTALGIRTCEALLALDVGTAAQIVDIGRVLPLARLLRLPGVDGALAVELLAAGCDGYASLVLTRSSRIVASLARAQQAGRLTAATGAEAVRTMQLAAAKRLLTATLLVRVRAGDPPSPMAGCSVTLAGDALPSYRPTLDATSDAFGRVIIDGVRGQDRPYTLVVDAPGRARWVAPVQVTGGEVHAVDVRLAPASPPPDASIVDEPAGATIGVLNGREIWRFTALAALDPLAPGTPLWVTELHPRRQSADLLVLLHRLVGIELQLQTISVPMANLPTGLAIGDVVRTRADGTLEPVPAAEAATIVRRRLVGIPPGADD
jgi:hypothetical protein